MVDDNPDIRAYVRTHLAPRYRVLEAADGRQALALTRDGERSQVVEESRHEETLSGQRPCRGDWGTVQ